MSLAEAGVLACSVRGCGRALAPTGQASVGCSCGHAFDRARHGYWNLLQPQDRRSPQAGDPPSAIAARRRWIARGLADPLADAVRDIARIGALAPGAIVVDLGCGSGDLSARLVAGCPVELCGIDLSVAALRLAARAWPASTWVVANADRFLPLPDRRVDLVLSLYGRRPAAEVARVLRAGGTFVVAVPGADDLIELRQAALGRGLERDRASAVVDELAASFRPEARHAWRQRVQLDRAAIEDALALTYRGARRSTQARVAALQELEVTLSADLLRFAPRGLTLRTSTAGAAARDRAPRPTPRGGAGAARSRRRRG